MRGQPGAAVAVAALLAGACTPTYVTAMGPRRPSRPEDCLIEMFPTTVPPYPFTPIAKARTECDPVRRNSCVEQLRSEACRAGADAVVGFKESTEEWMLHIDATFVVKGPAAMDAQAPAAPAATGVCDPICSPGFACQSGQCIPQCNPPCQTGEVCNRKRTCEPAAAAPRLPATDPLTPGNDVVPRQ